MTEALIGAIDERDKCLGQELQGILNSNEKALRDPSRSQEDTMDLHSQHREDDIQFVLKKKKKTTQKKTKKKT